MLTTRVPFTQPTSTDSTSSVIFYVITSVVNFDVTHRDAVSKQRQTHVNCRRRLNSAQSYLSLDCILTLRSCKVVCTKLSSTNGYTFDPRDNPSPTYICRSRSE